MTDNDSFLQFVIDHGWILDDINAVNFLVFDFYLVKLDVLWLFILILDVCILIYALVVVLSVALALASGDAASHFV